VKNFIKKEEKWGEWFSHYYENDYMINIRSYTNYLHHSFKKIKLFISQILIVANYEVIHKVTNNVTVAILMIR